MNHGQHANVYNTKLIKKKATVKKKNDFFEILLGFCPHQNSFNRVRYMEFVKHNIIKKNF